MNRPPMASLALAASLVGLLSCNEPKATPDNVRIGMTEEQVIGLLGKPHKTTPRGTTKDLEFVSYDEDRWFGPSKKENIQVFNVRLVRGQVESVARKGDLESAKALTEAIEVNQKMSLAQPEAPAGGKLAVPPAFDLRAELEKLERLKKDGLISEAEFKELRQRVLDKAKAQ